MVGLFGLSWSNGLGRVGLEGNEMTLIDEGLRQVRPVAKGPNLFSLIFGIFLRLIVPVAALSGVFFGAFWGMSFYVTSFDVFPLEQWYLNPGYWLTYGHLILPAVFVILNLVNRRFGPGLTIGAIVFSWLVLFGGLIWAINYFGFSVVEGRLASLTMVASFVGALFTGQLVCTYSFDRLRGIPWWHAPFYGSLLGGLVFAFLFYGQMSFGAQEPWANRIVVAFSVQIGWAFVGLVPYQLMRGFVRPLPGFGGA